MMDKHKKAALSGSYVRIILHMRLL